MMLQDNVARARERPTAAWTFFFRNFSVASRLPPASRCATCQPCSWAGAAPVRGRGANDGRAEWRDAGGASREGHGRRRGRRRRAACLARPAVLHTSSAMRSGVVIASSGSRDGPRRAVGGPVVHRGGGTCAPKRHQPGRCCRVSPVARTLHYGRFRGFLVAC